MNSYLPECLILSLGDNCNLDCLYCYRKSKTIIPEPKVLNETDFLNAVKAASKLVAKNCKHKKLPFHFGFQGDGEALSQFTLLQKSVQIIKEVCLEDNLPSHSFITTNGNQSEESYLWLLRQFSRITFSIDGTESIHNAHRKYSNGKGSYHAAVNSLNYLKSCGAKNLACRSTITKMNVQHQAELAEHLITDLGFREIQFEPVYNLQGKENLCPAPENFVKHFYEAKKIAKRLGVNLIYSGLLPYATYFPYCSINKQVLFLTRTGKATACMFRESETDESIFSIGRYSKAKNRFELNAESINKFNEVIHRLPEECVDCELKTSCAKSCPDYCIIEENENRRPINIHTTYRCKINREMLNQQNYRSV